MSALYGRSRSWTVVIQIIQIIQIIWPRLARLSEALVDNMSESHCCHTVPVPRYHPHCVHTFVACQSPWVTPLYVLSVEKLQRYALPCCSPVYCLIMKGGRPHLGAVENLPTCPWFSTVNWRKNPPILCCCFMASLEVYGHVYRRPQVNWGKLLSYVTFLVARSKRAWKKNYRVSGICPI